MFGLDNNSIGNLTTVTAVTTFENLLKCSIIQSYKLHTYVLVLFETVFKIQFLVVRSSMFNISCFLIGLILKMLSSVPVRFIVSGVHNIEETV